ncbi:MAG: sulfotransferase [Gemmatimonadetes bacterium]|nr:sulfotransferase [Gemmatimonadota bacterium]
MRPPYRARLRQALITSLITAIPRWLEWALYGLPIARTRITKPSIIILGFPRSGTTLLHNLLAHDPDLGYCSNYQAAIPFCLVGGERLKKKLASRVPENRGIDNVAADMDLPQEEVFAHALHSHRSVTHAFTFPSLMEELHQKYVLMEASDAEVRAWRRGYMKVVKKATYMHGGKRVVQKATPNLGRLPQIMEMFPGAYYIHIVRNPYDLYPSYMHMLSTLTRSYTMEDYDSAELEAGAVRMYQRIMQNYLRDRSSIPSDRFIEMRFEDLRRDPMGEISRIYRSFDLDWERAEPPIADYAATLSSYKQNQYEPDPRVREQVDAHWRFAVDEWNYGSPPYETP